MLRLESGFSTGRGQIHKRALLSAHNAVFRVIRDPKPIREDDIRERIKALRSHLSPEELEAEVDEEIGPFTPRGAKRRVVWAWSKSSTTSSETATLSVTAVALRS